MPLVKTRVALFLLVIWDFQTFGRKRCLPLWLHKAKKMFFFAEKGAAEGEVG